MPSATLEEYLEAIYKLSLKGEVRPTRIAEALDVSGATVTASLGRLRTAGLIERPDGGVRLTEAGSAVALDIVRKHRVAERFLVDVLGLGLDEAHEEACALEHALSPRVLEALEQLLSNPSVCPHGHPIPAKDGSVAELSGVLLSGRPAGSRVRVIRIDESDEQLLSQLSEIGLVPGSEVTVIEATAHDGPLLIEVAGRSRALARAAADCVVVAGDD